MRTRIFVLAGLVALIAAPFITSAITQAAIQAQLKELLAQRARLDERIAALQAQLGGLGQPPVIQVFSASSSTIPVGMSVRLAWKASGIPSDDGGCYVALSDNSRALNVGNAKASGTIMVAPKVTTTYTLTCMTSWKDGSPKVSQSLTVVVGKPGTVPPPATTTPPVVTPPATTTSTSTSPTSAGTISFSTDPASPGYALVSGGAAGVTTGAFKASASGEDMQFSKLTLRLASGAPGDLTQVYVYDRSGTLLGTAIFVGTQTTATLALQQPGFVRKDGSLTLFVKADMAGIGSSQPGTVGNLVRVEVGGYEATGVSSGAIVRGTADTTTAGVRLFKSYPTIARDALPQTGLADGRLARIKITASPSGPVGIAKLSFSVAAAGVSVQNLALYGYTDAAYSMSVSGQGTGGLLAAASSTGTVVFNLARPLEIPAGTTYYLELRGSALGVTTQSSVAVGFLSDAAYGGVSPVSALGAYKFVWSGNSRTVSAFTDADWSSGYGIPGAAGGVSQTRVAYTEPASQTASVLDAIEQFLNGLTAFYLPN